MNKKHHIEYSQEILGGPCRVLQFQRIMSPQGIMISWLVWQVNVIRVRNKYDICDIPIHAERHARAVSSGRMDERFGYTLFEGSLAELQGLQSDVGATRISRRINNLVRVPDVEYFVYTVGKGSH